ncbi:formate dehydrogenase accessory sulfurtransferase FdhD [Aliiglaciecola sp. M165]|uniref:formate dehydrogenase accessory sulfurtransferase FdhD n=1 Tax=Aliiglaciecola sp. M165 TaxID=2593649 RepID=UPI00117D5FB4|nr:formate dehydrogenase accessory sulfurtransferase FdhD [Aliiglaciecola sp. M165]TRY29317.1 formate dehydrogenase [Aliiglaciecola sp. M165]
MTHSLKSENVQTVTQTHTINRFERGQITSVHEDSVVVEEPLEIWVKQYSAGDSSDIIHLSTTMRTPGQDFALVKGWLHSLNVINLDDITDIKFTGRETLKQQTSNRILVTLKPGISGAWERVQHNDFTHSSCGVCGQQSIEWLLEDLSPISPCNLFDISAASLHALPQALQSMQSAFSETGGCHGVGLFDASMTILDCQEDVGRHNAMDKLVGNNLDRLPGPFGVVLSGRVSFEMVQKAARARVSMIVAVGAPTSLAIELCREFDIALAGFVKSDRYNVYTSAERFIGATEK